MSYTRRSGDLATVLDERSIPEPNTGCHLWLSTLNEHGYAAQARMSVERADALLTALAETPPPACVDVTALSLPDQLGQTLDFWLSNFRHVLTAGQL